MPRPKHLTPAGEVIDLFPPRKTDPEQTPAKSKKKANKSNLDPLLGEGDRVDWNTPRIIVELTKKVGRGAIGLDPCSNPNSIVGALESWSLEKGQNGLDRSWAGFGLVYVNPPYGDAIVPWIAKNATEAGRNSAGVSLGDFATSIVSLLPSRTDTLWFGAVYRSARALAFWRGRLTFLGAPDPAPFPSFLPYYGPNPYLFCDTFAKYAEVSVLAA